MEYKQEFDIERCPWNKVCGKKDTAVCCITCPRYHKIHYLIEHSMLPEQYKMPKPFSVSDSIDKDAHERLGEIKDNIDEFVSHGKNLMISGNTGSGKTHFSTRMILTYLGKIWEFSAYKPKALFVNVSKLLLEREKGYGGQGSDYFRFMQEWIPQVDLVVWDDFFLSKLNNQAYETLFSLVDSRQGKANIYTTNAKVDVLKSSMEARLFSRVVENSEHIEFRECDMRGVV